MITQIKINIYNLLHRRYDYKKVWRFRIRIGKKLLYIPVWSLEESICNESNNRNARTGQYNENCFYHFFSVV